MTTNNGWISVSERLPPVQPGMNYVSSNVLAWDGLIIHKAYCHTADNEWWEYGVNDEQLLGITHWMPMPVPPTT